MIYCSVQTYPALDCMRARAHTPTLPHTRMKDLTASMMTESGVLAVKTKPSPLAPLTSAPSSGEEAW